MSDNTSTETLMELIKAYVPETEVPMVASFVLKLAGDLSLEQEKTRQLREALSDLRKAAHAAWVLVPLGQPENKWLKNSADYAQQLLAATK